MLPVDFVQGPTLGSLLKRRIWVLDSDDEE
jgi:hypothetical protein